jgi:beta-N-acetylhexosaminidase
MKQEMDRSSDAMTSYDWSLAQKVGQLFMVGFERTAVTPELARWMARFHWGGLIVFGRNMVSPEQLATLLHDLQTAIQSHDRQPLLMAVDQEGGRVARLKTPFTNFSTAATVGWTGSDQLAAEVGSALAAELHAVGINMDMAPVLDVLTNPANTVIGDRAFGSDPHSVARLGAAFIRGLHTGGVLAVAKHFPGHGDTRLDSHVARPVSTRSRSQLESCELMPFREAIAAGVDAIMTAHVVYPAWDAQLPATLSPTILTGVLRQEMGYTGVIVSDDLGMAAVAQALPWGEVPVRALQAGVDLLLICHDRQRQEEAYDAVVRAIQDGRLPEELIDRAVARVGALKGKLMALQDRLSSPSLSCIGCSEHQALAETLRVWSERPASSA